jgi:condensin complex subunit 2
LSYFCLFQASCTLDASVKIYSNRVDDTYSSSHRILESLSRNGGGNGAEGDANNNGDDDDERDDAGADGEGEEGAAGGAGRKRGAKAAAAAAAGLLGRLSQTVERNLAALNVGAKLEHDYAMDPMFHKISKAFDEGGAKGMLMNNLVS